MELQEFENIAPQLRREDLYSSQRDIIRQLKHMANKICRDSIPSDYINKSFNKFKQGYVYYDTNGATSGFCIWSIKTIVSKSENDRHVLYIHFLCGNRMTQYMCNTIFPDVERFCRKNSIDAIQLEPANDFLKSYYESYGFILTDTYSQRMTKRIH